MTPRWRERLRLPLLALVGLNVGVYFAYTLPRTVRERNVAVRADVLRADVERQRRATGALRLRAETMVSNRGDVSRFYARLGSKASLLDVRAQITALASELGLKVGALVYSPEDLKGGDGVAQLHMKLPVSGTYRELAAFLDRLERSSQFVTVDQIALRKRQTGGQADLDISLTAFYRAPVDRPLETP